MRSLDTCEVCHQGRMKTQGTKQLARGDKRVRALKCSFCGATGREVINGPARPRPKRQKGSRLEHLRAATYQTTANIRQASGRIQAHSQHAAAVGSGSERTARIMFLKSIFTVSQDLDLPWQDVLDGVAFGEIPKPVIAAGRLRFCQRDLDAWAKDNYPVAGELSDDEYMSLSAALLVELRKRKDS